MSLGAWARRSLKLAAAGFLGLGCRQAIGLDQYFSAPADAGASAPAEAGATACGLPYGSGTCAACAATNCCAESNDCAPDKLFCGPYESCLGACNGDPACRSKCTIDHGVPASNAAPVSALSACLASKCEIQCGLTCGGFAGYISMPDASAACEACIEQGGACNDARSCGSSAECDAVWRCWLSGPFKYWGCDSQTDAGLALLRPLYSDFSGSCAGPCGYGAYWACAGHVVWPSAASAQVTSTGWVYNWQSRAGVSGEGVSVCTGCPCPTAQNYVVAQGQTDSDGYWSIPLTQGLSPTGQGSQYCFQVAAPGYLTAFAYQGFPIVTSVLKPPPFYPPTTWGITLLTPSAQMANSTGVGAVYDPTRSIFVGGQVFDCLWSPAAAGDVQVSIDTNDPMMVTLGAIDAGADAWPTAATGASGLPPGNVLFLNVPLDGGTRTLTATVPGVGRVSQVSGAVGPNTVTEIALVPTP